MSCTSIQDGPRPIQDEELKIEDDWVKEGGVDCIVWQFASNSKATVRQESDRRRKLKNTLAVQFPDTIMLDTQEDGKDCIQYCDAIVYTER
jgi:hypothetical protein